MTCYCSKCIEASNDWITIFKEQETKLLEIPPIPKEIKTCDFCDVPCNTEWCCMNKENK